MLQDGKVVGHNRTLCTYGIWMYTITVSDWTASVLLCVHYSTYNHLLVFPKQIYTYPLYVNVSFHSCPSGFSLTVLPPFKCDCNDLLKQMPEVKCSIQNQLISRLGSVWIGKYGNKSVAASKYCPLSYCHEKEMNITLTYTNSTQHGPADTDIQCTYNHSGILCGGCQPGLSLVLGSDRCLKCSNYFFFLLLVYTVAGIILVFFIKVLNSTWHYLKGLWMGYYSMPMSFQPTDTLGN